MVFVKRAWTSADDEETSPTMIPMPASIFGATAINMLELFVAFLQAYIFAFLASLFIGMAVHPH